MVVEGRERGESVRVEQDVDGTFSVHVRRAESVDESGYRTDGFLQQIHTLAEQFLRVAPDAYTPYTYGTGILYEQLGQTCVPVATNIGHFWPKRQFFRKPATAIIQFLDPIEPGLPVAEFMPLIESGIETASKRLLAEARAAE